MNRHLICSSCVLIAIGVIATSSLYADNPCTVPDNGTGTVDLPPLGCAYLGHMQIVDGLTPGDTIEIDASWQDFECGAIPHPGCSVAPAPGECEAAGGTLGGTGYCSEDWIVMEMTGTGTLTGYYRLIWVPVVSEIHTGPRNPGDPVQTFQSNLMKLQGELFGDPDFCIFRVQAGNDVGLPSPGQMTLTELPSGDFAVDSFFDITYQIEFEGCPGSPLDGMMGLTTDVSRFETGFADPTGACCADGLCSEITEADCTAADGLYMGDNTLCLGDNDGDGYDDACACVEPDNGTGTVDLPAKQCPFTAPIGPMYIIDGLPAGSTLELDPVLRDPDCQGARPSCSLGLAPGVCESLGGTMGGNGQCFEATLLLDVVGTGDLTGFSRTLSVAVECEIHTGPRNPGDPVQTFTSEVFRLYGELFGDPDFCMFRVIGGSDYGLPCPGETTLTQLPSGDFAVDSFFDITYQIEFEGCPGSQLDDYFGVTTEMVHLVQGTLYLPEPHTCEAPNNGGGTVDLPADCPYVAPDDPMYITEGLPTGSTLELEPMLDDYANIARIPGVGYLGGEVEIFDATLDLVVSGTGDMAGFNRHLAVPVLCNVHTGPRNPGDPVQTIACEMFRMTGELFGDPDFCTFRVRAGTSYGMAGAGTTVLTELPSGDFAVDSFFDITYEIEFEGCPDSQLADMSGTTRATVRLLQGDVVTCYPADGDMNGDILIDGFDIQLFVSAALYGATPAETCHGDYDGNGSLDVGDIPAFVDRLLLGQPLHPICVAPDNGGTVDLPANCPMIAPDGPVTITEGLPVGSTLELDPTLEDFDNIIRLPGGTLGGEIETFDAWLDLFFTGTGDLAGFNRNPSMQVVCEIHTGPRNPGDPVQTLTTELVSLQGELFGDPDFCVFRFRAGSDFGLPSPGRTTLTKLPSGEFAVDSFFDITYEIEFEGCPGSPLDGLFGTTTGTVHLVQGDS